MKILLIAILMFLMLPKTGSTEEITPGQVFPVPYWEWIDIIATRTTSSGTCGIGLGDQIKVLAVENNTALVEYQRKTTRIGGTSCTHGIIFLIDTTKLKKFNSEHRAVIKKIQERKALINRLILKSRKNKKK